MKKAILTLTILLGMTFGAMAQGGLFQYGAVSDEEYYGTAWYDNNSLDDRSINSPLLPSHNQTTNQNAPLGSGVILLLGLGGAYAWKKRSKK